MNDYPDPDARIGTPFALRALGGFLFTPCAVFFLALANVPALIVIGAIALVVMLFFSSTRAFALGGLLSIGVGFLALMAICGNSHF